MRGMAELIQEMLDRSFYNPSWKVLYPEANVSHLTRLNFDHCPILIELDKSSPIRLLILFRFQPGWLSCLDFLQLVRESWGDLAPFDMAVNSFTIKARTWNKEVFGNIFVRNKKIAAKLSGIQVAISNRPSQSLIDLEKDLRREYVEVLRIEEEL